MTNGLLYKADCEEDIDLFLNYITFKKAQKINPLLKIQLLEPVKRGNNYPKWKLFTIYVIYCHRNIK